MFWVTPFFGGGATPHAVSCLSHEPMVWRFVTFHVTLMQKLEDVRMQKSVSMYEHIHIQMDVYVYIYRYIYLYTEQAGLCTAAAVGG